jgi:hypothetical protein
MFGRYNIRGGILISFCIAVLASIPMLIRQNVWHFVFNVVMLIVAGFRESARRAR